MSETIGYLDNDKHECENSSVRDVAKRRAARKGKTGLEPALPNLAVHVDQ